MTRTSQRSLRERPAGRRLSRQFIVDAAITYVDQHGNRAFTMRDIGNVLGVEAMALYRYVNGREDLLEAVVSSVLEGATDHLDDALTSTWQGYLQTLANAIRQIALDHPGVFPLVAMRHPEAPWLRPPLRSFRLVRNFLGTLSGFGFSDEQVVATYRAFSSFLLGILLLEAAQLRAKTTSVDEPVVKGDRQMLERAAGVDVDDDEIIRRFRPLLSEDRSTEEFETALETLLDRLEMSVK